MMPQCHKIVMMLYRMLFFVLVFGGEWFLAVMGDGVVIFIRVGVVIVGGWSEWRSVHLFLLFINMILIDEL